MCVSLPWMRRDLDPAAIQVIVTDQAGTLMLNVWVRRAERKVGEVIFEPLSGPGEYYLYYLPFSGRSTHYYPEVSYLPATKGVDPAWQEMAEHSVLPEAELLRFESASEHHTFTQMERVARPEDQWAMLYSQGDAALLVFPEDREHPIRMTDDIPQRWAERGQGEPLALQGAPGEWLAFQLGVLALRPLEHLQVTFGELWGAGAQVPATAFTCLNMGGVTPHGQDFSISLNVPKGQVQALWCGVQLPQELAPGQYRAAVEVQATGTLPVLVNLELNVEGESLSDAGDHNPALLSRLRWLNSRLGLEEQPISPYLPVTRQGQMLEVLGRVVTLGAYGFPEQLESLFTPDNLTVGETSTPLLARPLKLELWPEDGLPLEWTGGSFEWTEETPARSGWRWDGQAGPLDVAVRGELQFDGNLDVQVTLCAREDVTLKDVRLPLALREQVAHYAMGLGQRGGLRPQYIDWHWNERLHQDAVWVGVPHAGLQLSLRDEHYKQPLNTNFYHLCPLVMPTSWANGGRGGVYGMEDAGTFEVTAYSGLLHLAASERLHFNFRLLLTPFHPLATADHFRTRYFHRFASPAEVQASGATVVNVHHATPINPYINYPFLRLPELKTYVKDAHTRGIKVKLYYTVRELANRAPELWALRSLGHEIFAGGPGGGSSWLQEHLGTDYIGGWYVHEYEDAAIVMNGSSRWHNHYLEGLDFLAREVGIDGLYIDDLAFDRVVTQRLRRILKRRRPESLIDLHSANQFNEKDGFASSANLYLEHFPYLDRLWFGEYFSPDLPPDTWLIEMSGVPFGLLGEMLEGGGNTWRGALFGMTTRLYHDFDPTPVWRIWDAFGMDGARLRGWWVTDTPVTSDHPQVPVTTYLKPGAALVALASWAAGLAQIRLTFDWAQLGLDPTRARLHAHPSEGFQPVAEFSPYDLIPVEPGRGWQFTLTEVEP